MLIKMTPQYHALEDKPVTIITRKLGEMSQDGPHIAMGKCQNPGLLAKFSTKSVCSMNEK